MSWRLARSGNAPTNYISMSPDDDLTKATKIAIQEMIDFLVTEKNT